VSSSEKEYFWTTPSLSWRRGMAAYRLLTTWPLTVAWAGWDLIYDGAS